MRTLILSAILLVTTSIHAGLFGGGDFDARKGSVTIKVAKPPERLIIGVHYPYAPRAFGFADCAGQFVRSARWDQPEPL